MNKLNIIYGYVIADKLKFHTDTISRLKNNLE